MSKSGALSPPAGVLFHYQYLFMSLSNKNVIINDNDKKKKLIFF